MATSKTILIIFVSP